MDTPCLNVAEMISAARSAPERLGGLLERYRAFLTLKARCELPADVALEFSASDLVQETMIDAVRGFEKFQGRTEPEFTKWIRAIQAHNLVDALRKHRHREVRPRSLDDQDGTASLSWREPALEQTSPSAHLVRGEVALRVADMIESLSEAQAEAVSLRHLHGWRVDRIARHMGRSTIAVSGLLRHGLANLRRRMTEEFQAVR